KEIEERSIYIMNGKLDIDGTEYEAGTMIVFVEDTVAEVKAGDSAFLIIGGDRLEKPRYMWWNFVATSNELIEKARVDWHENRFAPIPNETGRVPLPKGNFPKPQPL